MSFSPLNLSPLLWLNASVGAFVDAGSTLATDGQAVQQWSDQSGNNHHALQATSGARPIYKATAGPGGKPCLRFDGVDDFLTAAISLTGTSAECWIVASRISAVSGVSTVVAHNTGDSLDYNNANGFILAFENGGSTLSTYRDSGIRSQYASDPGNGKPYLFGTVFDGANNTAYFNGAAQSPAAISGSFDADELIVGARYTLSSYNTFANYDVAEVLLFSSALSAAGRKNLMKCLNRTYGLYPGSTAFSGPLDSALVK